MKLNTVLDDYKYILPIILILGFILFLMSSGAIQSAAAYSQESSSDFRSLLERFNQEITENEGVEIAIRLHTPIIPEEDVIILPDKMEGEDDVFSRFIAEIGDDYVCFDTVGSSARLIECIPFSNIASIRHFVQ